MQKRKIIRTGLILAGIGIVIATAVVLYMLNKPHRDVQASEADFSLTNTQIITEYLVNREAADLSSVSGIFDDDTYPPSGPGQLADFIGEDLSGQWQLMTDIDGSGEVNKFRLRVWVQ